MERLVLKILNGLTAGTFVRIIWVYSKANAMHTERSSIYFYYLYLRPVIDNMSNVLHTQCPAPSTLRFQNRYFGTSEFTIAGLRTFP